MRFMQIESVLQTKNRSEPAKNRFSVALVIDLTLTQTEDMDMESQLLNDNVSTEASCPEIPVGRVPHFLTEWENKTSDKCILEFIREGYKLEFIREPLFRGIKETVVSVCQTVSIAKEIDSLLNKNATERVQKKNAMKGLYSTFFLVPKKNGEMRPVINLRPLNRYLVKKHFKMDTMTKILQLVEKGDWSITLDLSHAYFHLKIFKPHRKYLRFSFQGKTYQFRALNFGPTVAPRVFIKVTSVVAAHLRKQSILLATYLDDWLVLNQIRRMLWQDRFIVVSLLFRLGFIINKEKSKVSSQSGSNIHRGSFHVGKGSSLSNSRTSSRPHSSFQMPGCSWDQSSCICYKVGVQ